MHKREKYPEHYPEEYITGKVNFFGREFVVTPDVLIPRLETEGLVRRARQSLRKDNTSRVIDIGTGSGIIGVSCADMVDELIFLDIAPEALSIAEKNFRTHFPEKDAQFIVSDLLEKLFYSPPEKGEREGVLSQKSEQTHPNPPFSRRGGEKILFLANLPYIKAEDWEHMSSDTHFEPELALFGGDKTGFETYERLFEQIQDLQISATCIIEFGFDQRQVAEKVIQKYDWRYEFFPDYAGVERFCEIEI